jgi:phosphoglycerate dehydrogenase-like enzyme
VSGGRSRTDPSASLASRAESPATPRRLVVDLNASARRWALSPAGEQRVIEAAPPGWEVRVMRTAARSDGDGGTRPPAELLEAIAEAEVYFGFGAPPALLDAAPQLRWLQSAAAGVRSALSPTLRDRVARGDLVLTNAAGVMAVTMAEHVLGGVLHFLRGFDVAGVLQRARTWDREPWVGPDVAGLDAAPRELAECRLVVVGVRGVGGAVAERFSALGAQCIGVRQRPAAGAPPGFASVVGPEELDAALRRADVVVLAAPSTAATDRLLDARRLGLLPAGAIVVNVGRGTLVDEPALIAALVAGRLRGAVLDVTAEEPLPAESPLWALPNVLLTPHISATSPGLFWERMLALFIDNWGRWQRGDALRNVVDVAAGY